MRFWRWLFPDPPETAKCLECESVVSKSRMIKNDYGWFCNEKEFKEYWDATVL
jgi:hypothetical protein